MALPPAYAKGDIRSDGTVPFAADQSMGGFKLTDLGTPTAATDAATKDYVDNHLDWQESVLDKDLTAPPGGESAGDRYIVASVATGAWATHEDDITEWNGASWDFYTPTEGTSTRVEDENVFYVYDGATWGLWAATVDHSALINLDVASDHLLYVTLDGLRPMTGSWAFGSQALSGVTTFDATSRITLTADPAATPDDAKAIGLVNSTAATLGAQKYSPMLRFEGQGWETAVGSSMSCEIRQYLIPFQGVAAPTAYLVWESSINAGAYSELMRLDSSGNLGVGAASPGPRFYAEGTGASPLIGFKSTGVNSQCIFSLANDALTWRLYTDGGIADNFTLRDATNNVTMMTVTPNSGAVKFPVSNVLIGSGTAEEGTLQVNANPAATPVDTAGLGIINQTAATLDNQKYSPVLRFRGNGWETDVGSSMSVEMRQYLIPVQGAAAPSADLVWESSIDAGAYTELMRLTSAGKLMIGSSIAGFTADFGDGSAADTYIRIGGRSLFGYDVGRDNAIIQATLGKGIDFIVNVTAFGTGTPALSIPSAGNVLIGSGTAEEGTLQVNANPAATPVDTAGLGIINQTAATLDNQKYSPVLRFRGNGWETDVGSSMSVEMRQYLIPVQGAAAPSADLVWESSINAGAYSELMRMTSGGNVLIGDTTDVGARLLVVGSLGAQIEVTTGTSATGNKYGYYAVTHYTLAEEPVALVACATESGSNSVNFGGGSSSYNTATSLKFYTAATATTTTGSERMQINSAGNVLIGTTEDYGGKLQVVTPNPLAGLELRSVDTNNVSKSGYVTTTHYTNTEEPFGLFYGLSNGTNNVLVFGGGHSSLNSATKTWFYAGPTDTTTTGVSMMTIEDSGVRVHYDSVAAATTPLHAVGAAATGLPVFTVEQLDDDDTFINFVGTTAADGTKSISTDTTEDAAKTCAIRCEYNGNLFWIRGYADES